MVASTGVTMISPFMGGRRQFYGRGCAVVDVDGDGNEDVWLSNGDNGKGQDLFGVAVFSCHQSCHYPGRTPAAPR